MARKTQPYKRSFSASIGAGLSSVFGGSGKQYYILEHRISSKYHKVGEAQEIIIDNIEMGRDSRCQVRFDESFPTVSRRHAAIIKEGDKWKLLQLSQTNPTLLNGNKVGIEWYLQNGDEIQLSIGGPKLGFIVPKNAMVQSIGLSRRLSLFRQQALRPYKHAITALSILLILAIGGLSGWMIWNDTQHNQRYDAFKAEVAEQDSIWNGIITEQSDIIAKQGKQLVDADSINAATKREMGKRLEGLQGEVNVIVNVKKNQERAIAMSEPHVYFIIATELEIIFPDGTKEVVEPGWHGTGFMLNDGRFVTARHVIEPWSYVLDDDRMLALNIVANNGGRVIVHFTAHSSSNNHFSFTSDQFTCNRRNDKYGVNDDGFALSRASYSTDWAFVRTSRKQGLKYDANMSKSLGQGVDLTILGFPLGIGAKSPSDITSHLSTGKTTTKGLTDGLILSTNSSFEKGNSGGPVFYTEPSGSLSVIGIVSAGAGRSTGFIIPIAAIN